MILVLSLIASIAGLALLVLDGTMRSFRGSGIGTYGTGWKDMVLPAVAVGLLLVGLGSIGLQLAKRLKRENPQDQR